MLVFQLRGFSINQQLLLSTRARGVLFQVNSLFLDFLCRAMSAAQKLGRSGNEFVLIDKLESMYKAAISKLASKRLNGSPD